MLVFALCITFIPADDFCYSATKTPSKVKLTKVVKTGSASIRIAWKRLSKNCTGYQVYKSTKKNSGYNLEAEIDKKGTSSYIVKGLSPYTTYYFKLRAVNTCKVGQTSADGDLRTFGKFSSIKSARTSKRALKQNLYMCMKYGNKVYTTDYNKLYIYNLDTEELKKWNVPNPKGYIDAFVIEDDNYLYYTSHGNGVMNDSVIYAINLDKMEHYKIASKVSGYTFAVDNDNIVYKYYKGRGKYGLKCYDFYNGRNVSANMYTFKTKFNDTNDQNYNLIRKYDSNGNVVLYLKLPNGELKIGTLGP